PRASATPLMRARRFEVLQSADHRHTLHTEDRLVSIRRALLLLLTAGLVTCVAPGVKADSLSWLDVYRDPAARLVGGAIAEPFGWQRLAALTDAVGHRLSGSPQLDQAVQWVMAEMKKDGLENVHAEPVMVPRWVRGRESAEILEPSHLPIAMLGLGNSV